MHSSIGKYGSSNKCSFISLTSLLQFINISIVEDSSSINSGVYDMKPKSKSKPAGSVDNLNCNIIVLAVSLIVAMISKPQKLLVNLHIFSMQAECITTQSF